ncbi:MAG: DUF4411 family protein [Fimbriimonadaceae bacterium]|nr:DUF4411 family protein [Fimbriimonadaceae bacterium]
MNSTVYIVDTSALMDWHDRFYPPDVFATLVDLFDELIGQDRLLSVELVREELGVIGSAGLQGWAKAKKAIFDPTKNHLATALAIEGAHPGLRDPRAQYDEADAYVIALAQLRDAVVVTAETPAAHKRKPKRSVYIPDVCAALGMACITNLGMMRREGWKL